MTHDAPKMKRFQDVYLQVVLLGLVGASCPGIFNALNGLGRGGGGGRAVQAVAVACLNGGFAIFAYLGGAFFNLLGNKLMVGLGSLAFAIYITGMYITAAAGHQLWIAAVSGLILGVGAAWFWTAQGSMVLSYATPDKKGKYISTFWILFNLGAMIGGFIALAMNFSGGSSISSATFFVFIGIALMGTVASFLLLAPSESVVKEDGTPVVIEKGFSVKEEIIGTLSVAFHRQMVLMIIPFVASSWFYAFLFNGYNGSLFTIRTRGLNSGFYWASQMLGSWLMGRLLDRRGIAMRRRATLALAVTAATFNLGFLLMGIVEYSHAEPFAQTVSPQYLVDLADIRRFAFPFITYILVGVGDAMYQTCTYWILANVSADDAVVPKYAGFYKATQSLSGTLTWCLDLVVGLQIEFWLSWGLILVALPLMIFVSITCLVESKEMSGGGLIKNTDVMGTPPEKEAASSNC